MRIIHRRALIRLCCMRYSRMSVNRDRKLRRGDMDMGEWDGGIEKSGDDGGKETLWKGMVRKGPWLNAGRVLWRLGNPDREGQEVI